MDLLKDAIQKMELTLLMNVLYFYRQTQLMVKAPPNSLFDNLCYNKGIAPKFDLLILFVHRFVDDILKKS